MSVRFALITGYAFLRISHPMPELPGADVFVVSLSCLSSSSSTSGTNSREGRCGGSSENERGMGWPSSAKRCSASMFAISAWSNLMTPSASLSAGICEDFLPCLQAATSHTHDEGTYSSAHCLLRVDMSLFRSPARVVFSASDDASLSCFDRVRHSSFHHLAWNRAEAPETRHHNKLLYIRDRVVSVI